VSLPWDRYGDINDRLIFIDRLTNALDSQPGVIASAVSTNIPLSGNTIRSSVTVKGYVVPAGSSVRANYAYAIAGDYFAAMGLTLLKGRGLSSDDVRLGRRVCVVDEDFAKRYWPDGQALGQQLVQGLDDRGQVAPYSVIGVARAVKQAELAEQDGIGAVYYPYAAQFDNAIFVVTRTRTNADTFGGTLQRIVRSIDPELPVNNMRSMETRVADSLIARRSPAVLAVLYAIIALTLTAIGTYGVLSYAVQQRRREIAVRMALGARPDQVHRQFLGLAVRLVVSGSVLGLAGAWMAGRTMQAMLFHVQPLPVPVVASSGAVLALACLAACLFPSRRAARISPRAALAEE
jgi:ABC-type antimicrobial peptide transport system permease subunit